MTDLRIRIEGCRPRFEPRARWILGEFAAALGRTARFVDGEADCVYGPSAPTGGAVWIPADPTAQAFFERREPIAATSATRCRDLTLLFAPTRPDDAIPGDLVANAFYLMARWDEWAVDRRDREGRPRYRDSCFARLAGLDIADPPVEGYLGRLRELLGIEQPRSWRVFLTHQVDGPRRTPRDVARMIGGRGPAAVRALARPDVRNSLRRMLWTTSQRGVAPTVYLLGRQRDGLEGSRRARYEDERSNLARAIRASGGEVGLHATVASWEDDDALAEELRFLRAETGLAISGVRSRALRFRYHESVRGLERAGAEYDSSLGFADTPGYAAGIARPFHPYVIDEERPSSVELVPLAVTDTSLRTGLRLDARAAFERAVGVLEATRRAGGASALLWHTTTLDDPGAAGYGRLWEDLLDELVDRGGELGPVRPPAERPGASLAGRRILHVTSVHRPRDVRIFHKETAAARAAGATAEVLGLDKPVRRGRRLLAGWRLVGRAAGGDADIVHFHDPELLPAALWLARRTDKLVIYDVHEYLGETVRTKGWLPAILRRPLARISERAERAMARRLSGVVGSNEDHAVGYALDGRPVAVVTNAPWSHAFPVPDAPTEPIVLYVGGLSPIRGLDVMKRAFAQVTHPGARLLLVGPGDPGELADNVECLGMVDHSEIAGLVARSAVCWVPLQYSGNYVRNVPTKTIEAMASARPVVTSNFGRMAQIVRAAGCGILVPPDDPAAHAAAIDRLLGDPELSARLGAAGRRAFERGWSFERQADRLTSFYSSLLGAATARDPAPGAPATTDG